MRNFLAICIVFFGLSAYAQNEISINVIDRLNIENTTLFELQATELQIERYTSETIGKYEEFDIDIATIQSIKEEEFIQIGLNYQNEFLDLVLYETNFLEDSFHVYENNQTTTKDITNQVNIGKQYWGMIQDDINSLVTMSISEDDEVLLMVSSLDKQFVIHPKKDEHNRYLAYRNQEIQLPKPETNCELLTVGSSNSSTTPAILQTLNDEGCSTGPFVPVSLVADFDTYQNFNSSTDDVTEYVVGLMNQTAALYASEDIELTIADIFINTSEDGYPHTSSIDDLDHFALNLPPEATGNIIQLLSTNDSNLGGVAYLDTVCNNSGFNIGYSNVFGDFNEFPTYSWDVYVLSHEIGHNLGSGHTHSCLWSNGTVDDCGNLAFAQSGQTPEGAACWNESNPKIPSGGGSIMSYCHLINGVGINFSLGLLEPGEAIRQNLIANENCLPTRGISDLSTLAADNVYTTITANRICESSDWIEYYFDNNTLDFEDDIYVLAINPNGLNSDIFTNSDIEVSMISTSNATRNGGLQVDPDYKTNPNELFLAKRFWKVELPNQPSSAVGVRFPITNTDLELLRNDVDNINFENIAVLSLTADADFDPENAHSNIPFQNVDEYLFGFDSSDIRFTVNEFKEGEFELEIQSEQLYSGTFGVLSNKGNVKPYVLESFTASVNESLGVDIDWTTAEEFNSDFFFLEKSFNGEPFSQIGGRIDAAGFAKDGSNYSVIEDFAFVGETRYRLKMIGNRGTIIISDEIILEGSDFGGPINITPNPARNGRQLTVDLRSIFPTEGEVDLTIYNSVGQLVRTFSSTSQVTSVPISGFTAGTYFLEVKSADNVETIQFIIAN